MKAPQATHHTDQAQKPGTLQSKKQEAPSSREWTPRQAPKAIHRNEAIAMIQDGEQHELSFWKTTTGDIVHCSRARCIRHDHRRGTLTIKLENSGQIRTFKTVAFHAVDGMEIYF